MSKRILNPELIVHTVERLSARICERFPGSGLSEVCADLAVTARATAASKISRVRTWACA